jgi:hypothetical protein
MYNIALIGLFFVSLLPATAIVIFLNHEWNKYHNPFAKRSQSQFNEAFILAVSIASALFFMLYAFA